MTSTIDLVLAALSGAVAAVYGYGALAAWSYPGKGKLAVWVKSPFSLTAVIELGNYAQGNLEWLASAADTLERANAAEREANETLQEAMATKRNAGAMQRAMLSALGQHKLAGMSVGPDEEWTCPGCRCKFLRSDLGRETLDALAQYPSAQALCKGCRDADVPTVGGAQ